MKKIAGSALKRIRRLLLGLTLTVLVALQVPNVQDWLFKRLLQHLSRTTQFAITHAQFRVRWMHQVSIQGLRIQAPDQQEVLTTRQITLRLNPLALLMRRAITLQQVDIDGAQLQLCNDSAGMLHIALLAQRLAGPTDKTQTSTHTRSARPWVIHTATLNDCAVVLHQAPTARQHLVDHKSDAMRCHQFSAKLSDLQLQGDTLSVQVHHLSGCHMPQALTLDKCSTRLTVTPQYVDLESLVLQTRHSSLQGHVRVSYSEQAPSAGPWQDRLRLKIQLQQGILASQELASFLPHLQTCHTRYLLSGQVEGPIKDLQLADFKLVFGQEESCLQGHMRLCGLPDLNHLHVDATLQHSLLHTADLQPHITPVLYEAIRKLGTVQLQGNFVGTPRDMHVKAGFDTDLGQVTTDVALCAKSSFPDIAYRGTVATTHFDLGAFTDQASPQRMSMQGHIDGRGLTLDTAHFRLKGHIAKLEYQQHAYEHIHTHGRFARRFFKGHLDVQDPLLKLQAEASVDLSTAAEVISIQGTLQEASLQALKLTPHPATLKTCFAVALKGLSVDSLQANVRLEKLLLKQPTQVLYLKQLHAQVDNAPGHSTMQLDSDWLALRAHGNFTCTALLQDLKQFLQGYQRRLLHQPPTVPVRRSAPPVYTCTYQLHCKDMDPLLRILAPTAHIAPDTVVKGSFAQGPEAVLQLHIPTTATLKWGTCQWSQTSFSLLAKQAHTGQVLSAKAQLTSQQQQWPLLADTRDMAVEIDWHDDQIRFSQAISQQAGAYHVQLHGLAELREDATRITLDPSAIVANDIQWRIAPNNRITIGPSWVQFSDCTLARDVQQISLNGKLSSDSSQVLHFQVKDFHLSNLNVALKKSLSGTAHMAAQLRGNWKQPQLASLIDIHACSIDDIHVGDIHVQTDWQEATQKLQLEAAIRRQQVPTLTLSGHYTPRLAENSLQLEAHLAQAQLAWATPLVVGKLSKLSGDITGRLHITGTPQAPQLHGQLRVVRGGVHMDWINTYYQLDSQLVCDGQRIVIERLNLADDQQGHAHLGGTLNYQTAQGLWLDIQGDLKQIKLLQLAADRSNYVYGTGIASGTLAIKGPVDNVSLDLNIKTNEGTHLHIVTDSEDSEARQEHFIRFIRDEYQQELAKRATQTVKLQGLNLTLALDITPDMLAEIVLNTTSGDAIRGRGTGNITLKVDPNGTMTMNGGFEFVQGTYTLSLYRILKKTFQISSGSRITWQEDPYKGKLAVQGTYAQRVSIAPLLQPQANEDETDAGRKYPVKVVLALQGSLSAPALHFSILFDEPIKDVNVEMFLERTRTDQQYLMRQVISLILFKRIVKDSLVGATRGSLERSIGELLSRELSNLASSFDDNLDIDADVDLAALNQKGMEGLRVKLSYSLLNGRLRISRASDEDSGMVATNELERFTGTVTAEYLLTKDGRLRIKVYNKRSRGGPKDATQRATGGVSLHYTRSFNRWRDLFRNK